MAEVRGRSKWTVVIAAVASVVGLVATLVNGDTWQRTLITTLIYGATAAFLFMLVVLRPDRPRTAPRHNRGDPDYDPSPPEHS